MQAQAWDGAPLELRQHAPVELLSNYLVRVFNRADGKSVKTTMALK